MLQGNVPTEVDRTTGAGVVLHPVTFFVALDSRIATPTNSAPEPQKSDPQDLNSQESVPGVSTVGKSVTWSGNAPILEDSQSQPCQHQILAESQHSENSEVEYMFDLHEKYEYEQNVKVISVKSKLKKNICFWNTELNANSFILNVIKCGYAIPFKELPTSIILKNNKSSLNNADFVQALF